MTTTAKTNKNNHFLLWFLLFTMPYFGIPYMWISKFKYPELTKKLITIVFGAYTILLFVSVALDSSNETDEGTSIQSATDANNVIQQNENSTSNNIDISNDNDTEETLINESVLDNINFQASTVRNDNTGNWRISTIAKPIIMHNENAIEYYNNYFKDDSEIHGIVNFTFNTTTKISKFGNLLMVTVHEYVDGEEHDANLLYSGMLTSQYHINLDDESIEKIQ